MTREEAQDGRLRRADHAWRGRFRGRSAARAVQRVAGRPCAASRQSRLGVRRPGRQDQQPYRQRRRPGERPEGRWRSGRRRPRGAPEAGRRRGLECRQPNRQRHDAGQERRRPRSWPQVGRRGGWRRPDGGRRRSRPRRGGDWRVGPDRAGRGRCNGRLGSEHSHFQHGQRRRAPEGAGAECRPQPGADRVQVGWRYRGGVAGAGPHSRGRRGRARRAGFRRRLQQGRPAEDRPRRPRRGRQRDAHSDPRPGRSGRGNLDPDCRVVGRDGREVAARPGAVQHGRRRYQGGFRVAGRGDRGRIGRKLGWRSEERPRRRRPGSPDRRQSHGRDPPGHGRDRWSRERHRSAAGRQPGPVRRPDPSAARSSESGARRRRGAGGQQPAGRSSGPQYAAAGGAGAGQDRRRGCVR